MVLLEKTSAGNMRTMIRTMLTDSERRQSLIQELIQSNNQLKEDAQQHLSRAARHSQRASELEGVLDGVKGRVQDLEDSYIGKAAQQHSRVHQLLQDKKDMQKRHQALEQKLSEEKTVASELQRKLYFAVKEEERRIARQNQVFQQIHNRSAPPLSPVDQQVLDVIDVYEAQMQQLRDELRALKGDSEEASHSSDQSQSRKGTPPVASSSNHKSLLKSYQEQLKEMKAQREELKSEVQKLKQDLESRPTVKELKTYKLQLRRMDRIIKQNDIRSAEVSKDGDGTETSIVEGGIAQGSGASLGRRYLKMLNDISGVVSGPRAPLGLLRQRTNQSSEAASFERLLPTLEMWAEQLGSLKDLHHALSNLTQRLLPWQSARRDNVPSESVRVEDLMLLVETLLEETVTSDENVLRSPTKNTLQSMVAHFQKLFDAPSLSGVYPRMNEVYTRLGEMTNAMRNLRDVLALDDRASPSEVVNQVAQMVSSQEDSADHQLYNLLGTSDIESIIVKVKEHEEFFPAFHSLMLELLHTLDVQHLDDIMPALRSMKSGTQ